MSTDDAEIEAAAKRMYEVECGDRIGEPAWNRLNEGIKSRFCDLARAAQPPPKLCGTCRHWGDDRERREKAEFRCCQAIEHKEIADVEPTVKAMMVDAWDGLFRTRADFGCILYESTEAAPDAT